MLKKFKLSLIFLSVFSCTIILSSFLTLGDYVFQDLFELHEHTEGEELETEKLFDNEFLPSQLTVIIPTIYVSSDYVVKDFLKLPFITHSRHYPPPNKALNS